MHRHQVSDSEEVIRRHQANLRERFPQLVTSRQILFSDIDGTITGSEQDYYQLREHLSKNPDIIFCINSARNPAQIEDYLQTSGIPRPAIIVASIGSEIFYPDGTADDLLPTLLGGRWDLELAQIHLRENYPQLTLHNPENQNDFKLGYSFIDQAPETFDTSQLTAELKELDIDATVNFSHGSFVDVMPAECSKGSAIKYLAKLFSWKTNQIIVAGDSGNDRSMFESGYRGIVVAGEHQHELSDLRLNKNLLFSDQRAITGIITSLSALSR